MLSDWVEEIPAVLNIGTLYISNESMSLTVGFVFIISGNLKP